MPFTEWNSGGVRFRNRLVFTAAASPAASGEDGLITPGEMERLFKIGEGGIGAIITGAAIVHPSGKSRPTSTYVGGDGCIPSLKVLTEGIKKTGAGAILQLCHSGLWCAPYQEKLGRKAIAPSFLGEDLYYFKGRGYNGSFEEATEEQIKEVIEAFADAAFRAREAGFDGVEVHAAHDSLMAQFLSPYTNRRKDRWGGSLENRVRIHRETARQVKERCGKDFLLIMKLGIQDGFSGGLLSKDGVEAARLISREGVDVFEISQGLMGVKWEETCLRTGIRNPGDEGYYAPWSMDVRRLSGVPVILTGGIRSLAKMRELVQNGACDLLGICRPIIREADLAAKLKSGESDRARCISCNQCLPLPGKASTGLLQCEVELRSRKG